MWSVQFPGHIGRFSGGLFKRGNNQPDFGPKKRGGSHHVIVVIANSRRPGGGAFRAVKLTRKDAILTAVNLVGQRMNGVTIADEDGRVFGPTEFLQFFEKD